MPDPTAPTPSQEGAPAALSLRVRQLLFQLEHFLPRTFSQFTAQDVRAFEVTEIGEGEFCVMLGKTGIGIDCGVPVLVPSIAGPSEAPGYRVFTMHSSAPTRTSPGDSWDVTELESITLGETLDCVGALIARQQAQELPDYPAELTGPVAEWRIRPATGERAKAAATPDSQGVSQLPSVVIEMNGSVINLVRSSVPMRVAILDEETEGGDAANVRYVNGQDVYLHLHELRTGGDPGFGGVAPDVVRTIFQEIDASLSDQSADSPDHSRPRD